MVEEQVSGAGTLGPGARELREQLGRAGRWGGAAELEAGERAQRAAGGATTTGCRKEAELGLQGAMGDGRRELEQPTRWRSSGCVELDGATRADEPEQGTWPWLERGTVLVAVLEQGGRRGAMGAGVCLIGTGGLMAWNHAPAPPVYQYVLGETMAAADLGEG